MNSAKHLLLPSRTLNERLILILLVACLFIPALGGGAHSGMDVLHAKQEPLLIAKWGSIPRLKCSLLAGFINLSAHRDINVAMAQLKPVQEIVLGHAKRSKEC